MNVANSSPVYSGNYSISVTDGANYQALSLQYPSGLNTSPYSSLMFWINGGTSGGQRENVYGTLADLPQTAYPLTLGTGWQQIIIPLSVLGMANKTNFTGIEIQGSIFAAQPTFYVDDIQLTAAPAPTLVNLNIDASQTIRMADARWFGINTATWDGYLGNASTLTALKTAGVMALRWPGGSTSDGYHWATDPSGNSKFMNLATNLPGAQVFITVNYGTGTPGEAAAWVLSANKTNHCGFKYWEIGNECYGSWETDSHAVKHDPYIYATNAATYIQQMKAAYPAFPIKVGVVVVPGEESYSNNANHFAINPRTGATNYGWTPIVLSTLKKLGVTPDFLIYHFYPQYTAEPVSTSPPSACGDSDPLLLQVADNPSSSGWTDWASAAANLRQQITDYIGSPGTNIELCCTENNSDSSGGGKQLSSLVNALY
ncbi:MAG: alpha-L-arabinofuranosidase, partial [Limisphaerales bacterium]